MRGPINANSTSSKKQKSRSINAEKGHLAHSAAKREQLSAPSSRLALAS